MKLQTRKLQEPDISLTPMIDVVFLLLIFFMVSTSFDDQTQIKISLSEAGSEQLEVAKKQLSIVIDSKGTYYVDDREVISRELPVLQAALKKAADSHKLSYDRLPVVIKADERTPYKAMMRLLDAAGRVGLSQLVFAASQPKAEKSAP